MRESGKIARFRPSPAELYPKIPGPRRTLLRKLSLFDPAGASTHAPSVNLLPERVRTFGFDLADLPLQPLLDCAYRSRLVVLQLKFLERVSREIEGDEMTGNRLRAIMRANEIK